MDCEEVEGACYETCFPRTLCPQLNANTNFVRENTLTQIIINNIDMKAFTSFEFEDRELKFESSKFYYMVKTTL